MRRSRRQAAGRVHGNRSKKLRAAFRWRLSGEGPSRWLEKLATEYPGEIAQDEIPKPPVEATPELWHDFYWRAFEALRYDRQYGAFGGESPIGFVAIDAYARRYGIDGDAFDRFMRLVNAIDDEWLGWKAERAKDKSTTS